MAPLVSVICLCYNHASFVESAITSVLNQTYLNVEIIIVDDYSTDESISLLHSLVNRFPRIRFINNESNIGMCRSFNKAFKEVKGEYIIDFSCDDLMAPNRIEDQVAAFVTLDERYGVVFSEAYIIDEQGTELGTFYKRTKSNELISKVPSGDVFIDLLHSYKICSPTIMIRKKVLDELSGYNELLSYEDYDLFIRSSRNYYYYYIDKPLTYYRKVKGSDSSSWYKKGINKHLESTLEICKNAVLLCKNKAEINALMHSIRYHFRQSLFVENFELANRYYLLIKKYEAVSLLDVIVYCMSKAKLKMNFLFSGYLHIANAVRARLK